MEKINKTNLKKYAILVTVLLVIVLAVGGYFLITKNQKSEIIVEGNNLYYFPNGSFSAYFPNPGLPFKADSQGVPDTSNKPTMQNFGNGNVLMYSYSLNFCNNDCSENTEGFNITYAGSALKKNSVPTENSYEKLKNELSYTINSTNSATQISKLISSKFSVYENFPSIEYSIEEKGQNYKGKVYTLYTNGIDFAKGDDLYSISHFYQTGHEDKTLENTFLNSIVFGKQPLQNNTASTSSQTITSTTTDTTTQPSTLEPAPTATTPTTPSLPKIISEWSPNVALVLCSYSDGTADFGSGFLYKNNVGTAVFTNAHVFTEESTGDNATSCSFQIPGDSQHYTVTDPSINGNQFQIGNNNDWGFIEVANGDSYFNGIANKNLTICQQQEQTGDSVVILGYPDYAGQFINPTATQGIISGYASPYYTTSAQIESGNSGGVVIDPEKDCYIGIPSAVQIGNYSNLGRILNADVLFNLDY